MEIVELSEKAKKDLKKIPDYIELKLMQWVENIQLFGVREVRKVPGYHDKSLRGKRAGQRSIRLSKAYRAIYVMHSGRPRIIEITGE